MSGHSKWSNIKRQKESNDAIKGKVFSKMARLITVAAKKGGGFVDSNPSLRLAVEKAKEARMPKENIERAIAKGIGAGSAENFEETLYEGFGPGGEAFFVQALTDNKNRTVAEIRSLFSKYGGSLGGAGCTSYIFSPDPNIPSYTVEIQEGEYAQKLLQLFDDLKDHDDVQDVFVNFVII